jgi:hypothetical protein
MKLRIAGALLLVSIGAFASGCGTGTYGAAVTTLAGPSAAASSKSRALAWKPTPAEKLKLTPARKGRPATIRVRPTKATVWLGAIVVFPTRPVKGARYRFVVSVRGSSNLSRQGRVLGIGLYAKGRGLKPPLQKAVTRRWPRHPYVVTVQARSAAALDGRVYIPKWAFDRAPNNWIEIQGRIEQEISAVKQ